MPSFVPETTPRFVADATPAFVPGTTDTINELVMDAEGNVTGMRTVPYASKKEESVITRAARGAVEGFKEGAHTDATVGTLPQFGGEAPPGPFTVPLDLGLRALSAPYEAVMQAIGAAGGPMAERDARMLFDSAAIVTGAGPMRGPRVPKAPAVSKAAPTITDTRTPAPAPIAPKPTQALQSRIDEAGGDFAGNINLNRIYAPEDVKSVISETAAQNADFMAARRGVITQEETRSLAQLSGMTPEKLGKRITGQALNAEEMFAARELLVGQATRVRNLARQASGGSDLDKAGFAEEMTRLLAIQEHVAGATAEAGRALSQFRMMAGASREEIARLMEASKAGNLDDIIEGVRRLDNAPPEAIASFISQASKATETDQILELWINSLLSGPTTHAVNILSNSLVSALSVPEALIAAGISKVTGSGIHAREAVARIVGTAEGAKEGLTAALRAFRTEEGLFETSKLDVARQRAIPSLTLRKGAEPKQVAGMDIPFTGEVQLGGKQIRLPGRLLTAEDAFFKTIAYRQEINALATRQALEENLAGRALAGRVAELRASPSAEMTAAARDAAAKRTFTNPLGRGGQYYQGLVKEWPILRVLTPFVRTPTNIIKFVGERSPLAPVFKEVRETLAGQNGAAARDTQIARMALGSTIGLTAGYLASEGMVTGGGPVDPRKRALLYQSGWQPYSVRVGDTYYSFGRLEPLGMLFGIAADFVELAEVATDEETKGLAALITGSVARNLTSKTWLRGLSDAIEAFNDPDRYGQRWIMSLVGTVVPTGVAQWARTEDPYLREARTIVDKIRERLPGYRETLPFRRDLFGEPIKLEGGIGPDIVSPAYISTAQDDPTISEMLRLGVAPSKPTRMIRGVELNAEQYDALQVSTGQAARRLLNILTTQPNWKQIPDDLKKDAIMDAMRQARDVGRASTVGRFPELANAIISQQQRQHNERDGEA